MLLLFSRKQISFLILNRVCKSLYVISFVHYVRTFGVAFSTVIKALSKQFVNLSICAKVRWHSGVFVQVVFVRGVFVQFACLFSLWLPVFSRSLLGHSTWFIAQYTFSLSKLQAAWSQHRSIHLMGKVQAVSIFASFLLPLAPSASLFTSPHLLLFLSAL